MKDEDVRNNWILESKNPQGLVCIQEKVYWAWSVMPQGGAIWSINCRERMMMVMTRGRSKRKTIMIMILIISIIMLRFKIVIHKKSCWKIGQNSNDYSRKEHQRCNLTILQLLPLYRCQDFTNVIIINIKQRWRSCLQEGSEFWHELEDVSKVDEWKVDYCPKHHEQDRVEVFNLEKV